MTDTDDDYPPVGFAPIDRDHREIAVALRRLIDAVRADDCQQALILAGALIERVLDHFKLEKRLMEEISFPFIERHRQAHQTFLLEAQRVIEELRAQGLTLGCLRWAAETMGWFRQHVLTEDMALARALAQAPSTRRPE